MSITSPLFLGCCAAAIWIYWRLPAARREAWLFLISAGFLATWSWELAALLLVLASVNFLLGRWLGRAQKQGRALLWIGIGFNLLVLLVLKYSDFYAAGLLRLLEGLGLQPAADGVRLLAPVGLSFLTLQMISYLVDVRRGTIDPESRWLDFALYTIYFPKLLSGPIERARVLLPVLKQPNRLEPHRVERALWLIVVGLARKLILADALAGIIPDEPFNGHPEVYVGQHLAVYLLGYAFMIYNDFAGYTSLVRGLSGLFGIDLTNNFSLPYFARSFSEFWERWHASLSHWLRDYIYFPVSRTLLKRFANREHLLHLVLPPLTTMLFSGLWHGLAWNFVFWGALHGLFLAAERVLALRGPRRLPDELPRWRQIVSALRVSLLTVLAWIPFSMGLAPAWTYFSRMLTPAAWIAPQWWAIRGSLTGSLWIVDRSSVADWWSFGVPDPRVFLLLILGLALDWAQAIAKDEVFVTGWPSWKKALVLAALALVFFLLSLAETGAPFVYQGF